MGSLAILLVLASTFAHAFWNLIARRQRSETAFFVRMNIMTVVIGLLPGGVSLAAAPAVLVEGWPYLLVSGCCCGAYFYFLGKAYECSDFTVVYPVARALPVLVVGLADVLRGRFPSQGGWLGMVLVAAGCFLAPLRSFGEFQLGRYFHRASFWILLASLGTVGYSVSDKIAAEILAPLSAGAGRWGDPVSAAAYGYVFFVMSAAVLCLMRRLFERPRVSGTSIGWKAPAAASVLNYGCYWLILWAYQLAERASYIVAFRQFSIIIGVVLGFAIYREEGLVVRIIGALVITPGLVLIALWGG